MRSNLIHVLLASTALLGAASVADAKPRRVVVLEFDGPRQLADTGRSAVMGVLGEEYNIVATKSWDAARARASGRGPQQWKQASKQAGVDAVIEGWVQQEGRHHVLTIAVKDAATGQEIDTLSVRLKNKIVTTDATHRLAADLDDLLSWIDGDVTAEPSSTLPEVRPLKGARKVEREPAADDDEDDDDDELATDDEDSVEDDEDTERPKQKRKKKKKARKSRADNKRAVAVLDEDQKDTNDLVELFGPESKESEIVTDGKSTHVPTPTPRFFIGAGPYLSARGMTFDYEPLENDSNRPPDYPASFVKGFALHAAVFPLPVHEKDGRASGLGFSLDVAKSVASVLTIHDVANEQYLDCTVDETTWQLGVHYRHPIDFVTIGASGNFGKTGHAIVDAPMELGFADTAYSYLGAGASIELAVTEKATVGFNARYMYLLAAGNVTDQDAYGAGKAYGLGLGAEFTVPLPNRLFVRGAVDYRRMKIDFEGSGTLAQDMNVFSVSDAAITGSANVGVGF